MPHREYVNDTVNEITYVSQVIITILAYFFNILLIFIVQSSKNKEIGTYRILITYFAFSDLYYTTVHCVTYPIPENYGHAFFGRGHGVYGDRLGVGMYFGAYAHAFPILIFHFLYRLLAIKYTHLLRYFKLFMFALVLTTAASNAAWFSIVFLMFYPDEEILRVLTPIYNGSVPVPVVHTMESAEQHMQALFWTGDTFEGPRLANLAGAGIICVSLASCYAVIIACCLLIHKYLKEYIKSAQSIRLQRQLFRSLIYQSFVPLFTAYYPAGAAILLPIFGITSSYISIIVPPACGTHPLFDPLLIMFTITEYRMALFKLLGISKVLRASTSKSSSVQSIVRQDFTQTSAHNAE